MASISLCMIVRDEEAVLGRCLESVAPAVDEIILVDTGSVDGTKAVAAAYTDRIFVFAWVDDLQRHAMRPLPKRQGIIFCGWMQTMCCCRRIWMRCCV